MPIVPEIQHVYKKCYYPVACLFLLIFVEYNGVRTNCLDLLEKFERDVAADKRIDLQREGDMTWLHATHLILRLVRLLRIKKRRSISWLPIMDLQALKHVSCL